MERLLRSVRVNGFTVDVIEVREDDDIWYLLSVDDVVVNADGPLPREPGMDEVCALVRAWSEQR
jgi:hypothetical protein